MVLAGPGYGLRPDEHSCQICSALFFWVNLRLFFFPLMIPPTGKKTTTLVLNHILRIGLLCVSQPNLAAQSCVRRL